MNKEKLRKIPHIISAVLILLHCFERFETGHASYLLFGVAGFVFLSVAVFHHQLSHRFRYVDVVFYAIESLLSFVIAYEYWHAGKVGLPFPYVLAGLFQLFAIYIFVGKMNKGGKA